jgi:hypothetical protein
MAMHKSNLEIQPFVELMAQMFSRREFHFPLIAAQMQYRTRYYGLASAAMLEDLYFDALTHYVSTFEPTSLLTRPPRGEKGYDYEYNDIRISHKVSKNGPIEIAALWDATRTDVKTWTFETAISLTNSNYSPKKITLKTSKGAIDSLGAQKLACIPAAVAGPLRGGEVVALVSWPIGSQFKVHKTWVIDSIGKLSECLAFQEVWREVAIAERGLVPANEIELLVFSPGSQIWLTEGMELTAAEGLYRPGMYFFATPELVGVPIVPNNRGLLVPKKFIADLMVKSIASSQFVPLSNWFMSYAGSNPPDLYIAQKQDFDLYFSNPGLAVRSTNRNVK